VSVHSDVYLNMHVLILLGLVNHFNLTNDVVCVRDVSMFHGKNYATKVGRLLTFVVLI